MRARFLHDLGLGLVALGLLTFLGGCHAPNPRHGIIFRGDWSLELNRIPWMAERGGDGYQQPSEPCDSRASMDDSCQNEACKAKMAPGITEACDYDTFVAHKFNPRLRCLVKPCFAQSSSAIHPPYMPSVPSGGGNSRFFPVPTRPVFSPRGGGPQGNGTNSIGQVPIPASQLDSLNISPSRSITPPDETTNLPGQGQ